VDIIEIRKIERLLNHGIERLGRIFSEAELQMIRSPAGRAAVFAVKEAVFKALGRGWGQGPRWREIVVSSTRTGMWEVALSGDAHERLAAMRGREVRIAVAWAKECAIAQALILP
jgi:phosphopantetheine--protein transferase-like protein